MEDWVTVRRRLTAVTISGDAKKFTDHQLFVRKHMGGG